MYHISKEEIVPSAARAAASAESERGNTRKDYGEERYQKVGYLAGRMVMVVWTPRSQSRHIISMRKCNDREKPIYQRRFGQA
jgi:uncharacterized DUF497 family protein